MVFGRVKLEALFLQATDRQNSYSISTSDCMHLILSCQTASQQQQLKCWFYKEKTWLYLRGIGVERLHVAPEVLYFRNVLTDSEIEVVKKLGRPKVSELSGLFSKKGVLDVGAGV